MAASDAGTFELIDEAETLIPRENLRRETACFLSSSRPSARVWRNSDCVVLGRFLEPSTEVHMETARRLGVPVLKRQSGGGAVFHDRGNINYSLFLPRTGHGFWRVEESLRALSFPVIELLDRLNVPWAWVAPNNVYVLGRKISGSAQARSHGRILHHGTLLVETDLQKMGSLLKGGGRSAHAEVINLGRVIEGITVEDVQGLLRQVVSGGRSPVRAGLVFSGR